MKSQGILAASMSGLDAEDDLSERTVLEGRKKSTVKTQADV